MRASLYPAPPSAPAVFPPSEAACPEPSLFSSFSPRAFSLAARRGVPVFLVIGDICPAFSDPSVCAQLMERTVPVHLLPGQRPDVELLCRRAAALYSGEGALPLCALLLPNGLPFLAAPLPPPGFALDPSRLFVWLTHADRRYTQNRAAFSAQASNVLRSFQSLALTKPYSPRDAAHDLLRALLAMQDSVNGGFGRIKSPHVPLLRFLSQESARGSRPAHAALSNTLTAMLCSPLYDPVEGLFFSTTLTETWQVFVPEKPLAVNALLALTLLEAGRKNEAIRTLSAVADRFSLAGGGLAPSLRAPKSRYAFTPEQVTAALGSEDGVRACRLLSLLNNQRAPEPPVAPSRFSPVPPKGGARPPFDQPPQPLCPRIAGSLSEEDALFLRRAMPILARARSARESEIPSAPLMTADCALAAYALAVSGRQLGSTPCTHAAQRAALSLLSLMPDAGAPGALPPAGAGHALPLCGAAAALSLSLLTLGKDDPAYTAAGLRLLGTALHAFVREDGMVMHTAKDPAAFFPRTPAIFDDELPSPAALLVNALGLAHTLRPDAHYLDAAQTIWLCAAPYARREPLACASLIDAMMRLSSD